MLAIVLGLVLGKPVGIVLAAWLAVRFDIAAKPTAYTWRQLSGAGALAGIGFTMSLFIAHEASPLEADFAAAKIAIFLASLIAGGLGVLILWPRTEPEQTAPGAGASPADRHRGEPTRFGGRAVAAGAADKNAGCARHPAKNREA